MSYLGSYGTYSTSNPFAARQCLECPVGFVPHTVGHHENCTCGVCFQCVFADRVARRGWTLMTGHLARCAVNRHLRPNPVVSTEELRMLCESSTNARILLVRTVISMAISRIPRPFLLGTVFNIRQIRQAAMSFLQQLKIATSHTPGDKHRLACATLAALRWPNPVLAPQSCQNRYHMLLRKAHISARNVIAV